MYPGACVCMCTRSCSLSDSGVDAASRGPYGALAVHETGWFHSFLSLRTRGGGCALKARASGTRMIVSKQKPSCLIRNLFTEMVRGIRSPSLCFYIILYVCRPLIQLKFVHTSFLPVEGLASQHHLLTQAHSL